jgi:HEAT repeat protein
LSTVAAAPRSLDSLPWITKDGHLDMLKVPLESTYRRACEGDPHAVRDALGVLACAAGYGRPEAALFLLGFFVALPPEDWALRAEAVEAVRRVRTEACASLLLAEVGRVKSTNSTRR